MNDSTRTEPKPASDLAAGCLAFIVFVPIVTIVRGAVLAQLWEWFIADTFDVYAVSVLEAIGISIVISIFTARKPTAKKTDTSKKSPLNAMVDVYTFALSVPFFALLTGFIVQSFR